MQKGHRGTAPYAEAMPSRACARDSAVVHCVAALHSVCVWGGGAAARVVIEHRALLLRPPWRAGSIAAAVGALDMLYFPPGAYRIASNLVISKPILMGE